MFFSNERQTGSGSEERGGGEEQGVTCRSTRGGTYNQGRSFSGSDLETVSSLNLKQAFPHNQGRCHGKYIFKHKMKYKLYVNVFSVMSEKEIVSNRYHSEVCCECLRSIDIKSIFNYSCKFSGYNKFLTWSLTFLFS